MLKAKFALIWVCFFLTIMFLVSWVLEVAIIKEEANTVNNMVVLASEMALQGGQGIDDFFGVSTMSDKIQAVNGSAVTAGSNPLAIRYQENKTDSDYTTEANVVKWYLKTKTNRVVTSTYREMGMSEFYYDNDDFKAFRTPSSVCTTKIPHILAETITSGSLTIEKGSVIWITVPRIALMGRTKLYSNEEDYKSDLYWVNANTATDIYSSRDIQYGWEALQEQDYKNYLHSTVWGTTSYMLTPSKLGLSYVNRGLVEALYQNNLDLLMRSNMSDITKGNGIARNQYALRSPDVQTAVDNINNETAIDAINNGRITLFKNTSTIMKIEYQALDILNPENNALIESIYGAMVDYDDMLDMYSAPYIANADAFYNRSPKTLNYRGNVVNEVNHWIIVAKVTFSADVLYTYKTGIFTTWRTENYHGNANFNDIDIDMGDGSQYKQQLADGVLHRTDNAKYEYTCYYKVTA